MLPRTESDNVDNLRRKWEELMQLATKVRHIGTYSTNKEW